VAAALFQPLAAYAAGIGTLQYTTKDKAVPSGEPGVTTAKAVCPASHPLVTGGGVEITGDESGLNLEVGTTLPSANLVGWTAVANNSSGSDASMHVTAICARSHVTFRERERTVRASRQGALRVLCPVDTSVIGGGVGITGPSHKQEVASTQPFDSSDSGQAPDDGWEGRANNGLHHAVTMTVAAVCARAGSYRYVQSSLISVPDNSQVGTTATCPSGTVVTGGGMNETGQSLGVEVGDSFPFDGADADTTPDDGWQANANNDGTGSAQKMQTFAICKE
jgi:hypothetical protein